MILNIFKSPKSFFPSAPKIELSLKALTRAQWGFSDNEDFLKEIQLWSLLCIPWAKSFQMESVRFFIDNFIRTNCLIFDQNKSLVLLTLCQMLVLNRQQLSPLLYSIDIWPARKSRLTQRETNHYRARCASVLAWCYLAGSLPVQLVVDLFAQHQRFAVCCPLGIGTIVFIY